MTTKNKRNHRTQHEADGIVRQRRLAAAREHPIPGRLLLEQSRQLHEIIDPAVLAEEPQVQPTRWPEYGYMNAFEAMEAFTKTYVEVYPYLRKRVESDPHPCPVNADFVRNDPGIMNALYRGRQFADSLGLPYRAFILTLCTELMTTGLYQRVPMPNHLYPADEDSKVLRHAVRMRDRVLDARSTFENDWDQRLQAINYRGDPAQDRALQFMVDDPGLDGRSRLGHWMERGWISPENAQRLFPPAVYERAIERVGSICPLPPPTPGLEPYRPHCFGLQQAGTPACASCPWAAKCAGMVQWVERQQIAATGFADPRTERNRELARNRQREKRKRDKEAAAAAAMELSGAEATPGSG